MGDTAKKPELEVKEQGEKSKQTTEALKPDAVSDSEGDLSSGETRAWVDRRGKKSREVIPPATYSRGDQVKIRIRGILRAVGTIQDKEWQSGRREWDYMVQTNDGTVTWKGEDDLEPA